MAKDWYDVVHPGQRAKAEEPKPVVASLVAMFKAEYGDQLPADESKEAA